MDRNGAMPVPVAMKMVSRNGGLRMKSPNGPWELISSPSFMSHRKFDMKPSCTRLRQRAKRLSSPGGEAIEYARVISSPSGLLVLKDNHWPATKPKRVLPDTSNSKCLVWADRDTERTSRLAKDWKGAINCLDDFSRQLDADLG